MIFHVTLVFSCIIAMEMSSRLLARGKRWKIGKTFWQNMQFGYRRTLQPWCNINETKRVDWLLSKNKAIKKKMPNCSCICHHLSISILKIERRQTLIKTLAGSCWKLCPVSCWTPCDNYLPFQFKETKTFRQNKYLTKNHCNILPSLVISRQKKIYSIAT